MNKQILPVILIGAPASYHYQVAKEVFGESVTLEYAPSFSAVIAAVATGTHLGVIAVRNTIVGNIQDNQARITEQSGKIHVTRYYDLPIHHKLVTASNTSIRLIQKVLSHPAALQQCSKWIDSKPEIVAEERADTASAIHEVCAQANSRIAAIGSAYATKYYGGFCHKTSIANEPNNVTTFAIIEPKKSAKIQRLQHLRSEIDEVDNQIVQLLAQRFSVCNKVGKIKIKHNIPSVDTNREQELVEKLMLVAAKQHISTELIQEMYGVIFKYSRKIQQHMGAK